MGSNVVKDIPINTRFGWLTVKARVGNRWQCDCACGNTIIMTGGALRWGRKSCGCKMRHHIKHDGRLKRVARLDDDENAYNV